MTPPLSWLKEMLYNRAKACYAGQISFELQSFQNLRDKLSRNQGPSGISSSPPSLLSFLFCFLIKINFL